MEISVPLMERKLRWLYYCQQGDFRTRNTTQRKTGIFHNDKEVNSSIVLNLSVSENRGSHHKKVSLMERRNRVHNHSWIFQYSVPCD